MIWVQFLISSAILVVVGLKLAEFADVIAIRTGMGGLFVGAILLAASTSLPELLTTLNSFQLGEFNLAAGNLFGSNMFNMFMLGVLDVLFWRQSVLRRIRLRHAMSGTAASLLIALVLFFLLADINIQIGWVGLDSMMIILAYIGLVYSLQNSGDKVVAVGEVEIDPKMMSLVAAIVGFVLAAGILVVVTPWLVESSVAIAEITGLGTGFVGIALVGLVTSLPEMVTTIGAVRLKAFDMAVGNLFGSNMFNMFALGLGDVFLTNGRFLGLIDPAFALTGLVGLLLTLLAVVGNVGKFERKIWIFEIDATLLILGYIGGLYFLYMRGI